MANQMCNADLNDITLLLYAAIALVQRHLHDVLPTPKTSPYRKAALPFKQTMGIWVIKIQYLLGLGGEMFLH